VNVGHHIGSGRTAGQQHLTHPQRQIQDLRDGRLTGEHRHRIGGEPRRRSELGGPRILSSRAGWAREVGPPVGGTLTNGTVRGGMLHGGTGAASYPVAALIRLMIPAAPHYVHLSSTRYSSPVRGSPFNSVTPSRYLQGRHRWQVVSSPVPALPWGGFPGNDAHSGTPAKGATASRTTAPVHISAICMICPMVTVPPLFTLHTRVVPPCPRLCSPGPVIMLSLETYRAGFGGPASKCHHRWIGDSGGRLVLVHENADPFFVAPAAPLRGHRWRGSPPVAAAAAALTVPVGHGPGALVIPPRCCCRDRGAHRGSGGGGGVW